MYTVTTNGYKDVLQRCWNVKSPLYVYGGPGIGKSEIPRQLFSKTAADLKLKFVEWTDLTIDEKMECINNPDKYFVFCDQRVGQMDSTDLRGIPNMVNTTMLETIPMSWVIYFTQPKSHGVIFFDELNLAPPVVAGQAYQIINDRAIADRRLGNDVFVFGAGNRAQDQAHTFEMPFPLRDRFNELEIRHSKEDWVAWASTAKVNPHLVAFINWKESYLYKPSEETTQKGSTPRGIVRASKLIGDNDIISDTTHMFVSIAVGEAFATEFQAYCKHFKSLNWATIYKNPETVAEFEVDKLWAVIGGMTEQFGKGVDSEKFGRMMDVISVVGGINKNKKSRAGRADMAIVGLRMIKDVNVKKFSSQIRDYDDDKKFVCNFQTLMQHFGKFVIEV